MDYIHELRKEIGPRKIILNCAGAVIVREGKILFQRRTDNGKWGLIGGLVEMNETYEQAALREIREETGCSCMEIRELGIVEENRGTLDYTQINYYFLVLAQREGECCLTEAEKENAAAVQWHPLKKAADLITNQKFERVQGKYLCARDAVVLRFYEETCQL